MKKVRNTPASAPSARPAEAGPQWRLSRRALEASLLGLGAAALALRPDGSAAKSSGGGDPLLRPSSLTPFVDEMPQLNLAPYVARPVAALNPPPMKHANTAAGEARRDPHPAWETHPPQVFYELFERRVAVRLHRDLPQDEMWAYQQAGDPKWPDLAAPGGPTFQAYVGQPILVRIWNELPYPHLGYGSPETTTHLHDNHNTPESDGNAEDFYPKRHEPDPTHNDPGRFKDFHWLNAPAGGDPAEAMNLLWYHDHRHDFTAPNTYRGLVGMYSEFDELDSNDENAPHDPGKPAERQARRLPSGRYDVPVVLADKEIDVSGHLVFDQTEMDGILGNQITVNGKVRPRFTVDPRQYRFRILNPGPSRVFGVSLKVANNPNGDLRGATDYGHAFFIGSGGGMFDRALPFQNPGQRVPAQRVDVVIDFSHLRPGQWLYAVNVYAQSNGNKPDGFEGNDVNGPVFRVQEPGLPFVRFDLTKYADVAGVRENDPSTSMREFLPQALGGGGRTLRPPPAFPPGVEALSESAILAAVGKKHPFASAPSIATVRDWRFDRTNGNWAINNRLYDGKPQALCKKDSAEIWILRNNSGGWLHPVHIHFEKFRVLYRANGLKPRAGQAQFGRQDTLALGPGERAVVFLHFRDFTGAYLMHCHNTVHEDHAMMVRFDIVD